MPCGEIIVEYHEFFKLLYSGSNMGRPLLVVNDLQNILFEGIWGRPNETRGPQKKKKKFKKKKKKIKFF